MGGSSHVLEVVHLAVRVKYSASHSVLGHDYVTLIAQTGVDLPNNYGGVSGGGVWITPFSMDPDKGPSTLKSESPILAGVAFYQSEDTGGRRAITAHGTDSVYYRLPETIRSTSPG
jgi:hypothetical protein